VFGDRTLGEIFHIRGGILALLQCIHERANLHLAIEVDDVESTQEIIRAGKFQRIGDRRVVFLRRRKHAFDLSSGDQRSGRVADLALRARAKQPLV
jgi:hypothetical protein